MNSPLLTLVGSLVALLVQAVVLVSGLSLFLVPGVAVIGGLACAGVAGVVTIAYIRGKGRDLTLLDWSLHTGIAVLLLGGLLVYDCWGVSPSMFAKSCKFYDITVLLELAVASYAVVHLGGTVVFAVKWAGMRFAKPRVSP